MPLHVTLLHTTLLFSEIPKLQCALWPLNAHWQLHSFEKAHVIIYLKAIEKLCREDNKGCSFCVCTSPSLLFSSSKFVSVNSIFGGEGKKAHCTDCVKLVLLTSSCGALTVISLMHDSICPSCRHSPLITVFGQWMKMTRDMQVWYCMSAVSNGNILCRNKLPLSVSTAVLNHTTTPVWKATSLKSSSFFPCGQNLQALIGWGKISVTSCKISSSSWGSVVERSGHRTAVLEPAEPIDFVQSLVSTAWT